MPTKKAWFGVLLAGGLLVSCSSNDARSAANSHPKLPTASLDQPKPGTNVSKATKIMSISGWALADSSIESVSVYIDGNYAINAQTKLPRPDVQKVYPNMPEAAVSGWWANFPLTTVAPGMHDLLVEVKSGSGAIRDLDVSFTVQQP